MGTRVGMLFAMCSKNVTIVFIFAPSCSYFLSHKSFVSGFFRQLLQSPSKRPCVIRHRRVGTAILAEAFRTGLKLLYPKRVVFAHLYFLFDIREREKPDFLGYRIFAIGRLSIVIETTLLTPNFGFLILKSQIVPKCF